MNRIAEASLAELTFRQGDTPSTHFQKLERLRQEVVGGDTRRTYAVHVYDGNIPDAAEFVLVSSAEGALDVLLPVAGATSGRELNIKKTDPSTNLVTVRAAPGETVDGDPTVTLTVQWESVRLISDGTRWLLV